MLKKNISRKKALVVHSGGMDSSICLALAIRKWSKEKVLSLSFRYQQRHAQELFQAEKICRKWGVDHVEIEINFLEKLTHNALMDPKEKIHFKKGQEPNTLVLGRNGLMARLGAIYAQNLGARCIYMGIMELEVANSGYRDCSRHYMNLMEGVLRIDLNDPGFQILTPLVEMTKKQTMDLAHSLGILDYLVKETISCYEGFKHPGCLTCPACLLRNEGLEQFQKGKA